MCGYCIESEAISLLLKGHFNPDNVAALAKTDFEPAWIAMHFLPEFADQGMAIDHHFYTVSACEPVLLWIALRKVIHGDSANDLAFDGTARAMVNNGILQQEKDVYSSVFEQALPAFHQLLSSASPEQFFLSYQGLAIALTAEAKSIIREVSRDFLCAYFVRPPADAPFADMKSPTYTEEEHSAFHTVPFTLLLAADILLAREPDAPELAATALHIYPTPGFSSLMMAWQRYITWHWYNQTGKHCINTLGPLMRRELLLYLATRLKALGHNTDWFGQVAGSMASLIVDMNDEELLSHFG